MHFSHSRVIKHERLTIGCNAIQVTFGISARDDVAIALARAWSNLDPNDLTFENAALEVIAACARTEPALTAKFEENFRWREIL